MLAVLWIAITSYETWHNNLFGTGWYNQLTNTVYENAIGVVGIAALVWMVEQSRFLEQR